MLTYFLNLALLLPMLAFLIWGCLKLTARAQKHLSTTQNGTERSVKLVETCFLGPGLRLAVVQYRDREILLGCSKQGLVRLSETNCQVGTEVTGQMPS